MWDNNKKNQIKNLILNAKIDKDTSWYQNNIIPKFIANKSRYEFVAKEIGCPPVLIMIIHAMENTRDVGKFQTYLGNGQSLDKITTFVPRGRGPFKTWEDGAIDALRLTGIDKIKSWSLERALYVLESYNGFGYEKHGINSPYIWSFTNQYSRGMYVRDGVFDPNKVSQEMGGFCYYKLLTVIDPSLQIGSNQLVHKSVQNSPIPSKKQTFWDWISSLLKSIFSFILKPNNHKAIMQRIISQIPVYGNVNDDVKTVQSALIDFGFKIIPDRDFGPKTKKAIKDFQSSKNINNTGILDTETINALNIKIKNQSINKLPQTNDNNIPWFYELKKYNGKFETDPSFDKEVSSYWKYVGLNYNSIIGSTHAWCALFIIMGLEKVGIDFHPMNAAAKSADNLGIGINWKKNGIPKGAIVRINHHGICNILSSNHVSMANKSYKASELSIPNTMIELYGGNQGNEARVSSYPVAHICAVRWPDKNTKPPIVG